MNISEQTLRWLLDGDVALQYQVQRDLLGVDRPDLQARIATEGWGARFLGARHPNGHWGLRFYQPKWISSHYTLLDLRHLCLAPGHPQVLETINLILEQSKDAQGSINPRRIPIAPSDVCINGMFLNYACYFGVKAKPLPSVIDYLIDQHMPDGGMGRHGGGAFSGKDPTKVDRSGAYAARWVAKNIVAAGLAERCEVQVSYAIGIARPLSVNVETFGTGNVADSKIVDLINEHFDLRPGAIIRDLKLRRPIYQKLAAYGHFGRDDLDLTWEATDKADLLRDAAGL